MVELQPVDAVEVTLVVDNYLDVLAAGSEGVRRFPLAYDAFDGDQLMAEHGFSAWSRCSRAAAGARSCTTAA
jgi:7,8-dihydropterin-6-yl-methyl-4-(beta-D-ribofuranosyl)aminobenzene 5'-phosphate synthase